MATVSSPFPAAMEPEQFMAIVQINRDMGDKLSVAIERAERIHEQFFRRRRYNDFETAEQIYYRLHPSRSGKKS